MTTNPSTSECHDVVVVGARCAGAATAMLLAAAGHDVLLLDRATFPSDTLSTHAIARGGMVQLKRWGLLQAVLDTGAPAIHNVEFHGQGLDVARTIKERNGVDMALAPRRHVLDMLLVNAAMSAGVKLMTGVTVVGVRRADHGRITGVRARTADGPVEIAARFVVGADGLRSRIARSVGAPITELRGTGGAAHYAYYTGDWPAMEYHLAERSFAGVFPTNSGEACIWVCSPADDGLQFRRSHETPDAALDAMLRATAPGLADRIAARATRTSPVRGVIGMPNQIRRPVGPGWALVGDAGYHRDAITGHGISDAFRDADLLATALDLVLRDDVDEATALSGYHAERDRQLRDIFEITCALAQFPPVHRFIELQKQLSAAMDDQAAVLAGRPDPWLATT
jgi:flavin-dependent dehydrogenase